DFSRRHRRRPARAASAGLSRAGQGSEEVRRTASAAVLAVAFGTLAALAQQPTTPPAPAAQIPTPVFRSGADVIAIDVAVTTDKGDVVPAPPGASTASARSAASDVSSNEMSSSGRLVLFAFDGEGLSAGAGRNAALTA